MNFYDRKSAGIFYMMKKLPYLRFSLGTAASLSYLCTQISL